jgi:phosphate transport system protein
MNKPHTFKTFDKELDQLKNKLLEMGKATVWQLEKASKALMNRDNRLAEEVVKGDETINSLQQEVEKLTLLMLSTRQPLAIDLRHIIAGMKIAMDFERAADHAANVSKNTIGMNHIPFKEATQHIAEMSKYTRQMLDGIMDAYVNLDTKKAIEVWNRDDSVDLNFAKMLGDLRRYMEDHPESVEDCTRLILIGRCYERIGDHMTNIAEDIYYIATGETYVGSIDTIK